ncbi:unnamed protein product [Rhizophagus irregularis]|nr:unnamed protein product [Rhizophagus irregularis]
MPDPLFSLHSDRGWIDTYRWINPDLRNFFGMTRTRKPGVKHRKRNKKTKQTVEKHTRNLARWLNFATSTKGGKEGDYNTTDLNSEILAWADIQIEAEQSKWIRNTLDKQKHNIPIDRLLKQRPSGEMKLLIDPKEVAEHAASSYSHQFRKRNINFTGFHNMSVLWRDVYTPRDQHRSKYSGLLKEITDVEWDITLKDINENQHLVFRALATS